MPPLPIAPGGSRTTANLHRGVPLFLLSLLVPTTALIGQEADRLFPARYRLPQVLAGPRDPTTSAAIMGVFRNPNEHGPGVEAEVSLGTGFPVYLLAGSPDDNPVVVGIEAAAYARFGLQVLERELIATDWIFSVPVLWHHDRGWTRFRYYHSSSHMGDEYARRFDDPGIDFSRDAAEIFHYRQTTPVLGIWAGTRFAYTVHPDEDERWVLRAGAQLEEGPSNPGGFLPFLAADVEWDEEAAMRPRVEFRAGAWLPFGQARRLIRLSLTLLNGPSPLGQFGFRPTTQIGLTLQGNL